MFQAKYPNQTEPNQFYFSSPLLSCGSGEGFCCRWFLVTAISFRLLSWHYSGLCWWFRITVCQYEYRTGIFFLWPVSSVLFRTVMKWRIGRLASWLLCSFFNHTALHHLPTFLPKVRRFTLPLETTCVCLVSRNESALRETLCSAAQFPPVRCCRRADIPGILTPYRIHVSCQGLWELASPWLWNWVDAPIVLSALWYHDAANFVV